MSWKAGPLPAGKKTWNWGAIVTKDMVNKNKSNLQPMLLCGFNGDHATLVDGTIVKAEDIAFYNNSLTLPNVKFTPAKTELVEAE